MGPYTYIYFGICNLIPDSDLALLQRAERQHWTEIDPEAAKTPEAARALNDILKAKFHREQAACCCD